MISALDRRLLRVLNNIIILYTYESLLKLQRSHPQESLYSSHQCIYLPRLWASDDTASDIEWYFCRKPSCFQCNYGTADAATIHVDCYNLFRQRCAASDSLYRLVDYSVEKTSAVLRPFNQPLMLMHRYKTMWLAATGEFSTSTNCHNS